MSAWSFGALRSLLQQPPSTQRWDDLCALLDECDHPGKAQEAFTYARAHLERWPDELRRLPGRWLNRALKQDDLRGLELVRVIELPPSFGRLEALIERLESLPTPPQVHTLRCANHALSPGLIAQLDASPCFSCLEALNLENIQQPRADDELVEALGRCVTLRLKTLRLDGIRSDGSAWRALALSPAFRGLERLSLSDADFDDRALWRWLGSENFKQLRALDLSETPLSDEGIKLCLNSQVLPQLHELKLWGCFGAEGDALARVILDQAPRALTHLNLEATGLSDAGLALLLKDAAWASGLIELGLGHNALGPQSLEALLRAPLHKLRHLTLNDTYVHDEASWRHVPTLARSGLQSLTSLNMERTGLSSPALKGILELTPALETLHLGQNPITDEGLAHLRDHSAAFKTLNIAHTQLSTQALAQALGEGALTSLRSLNLSHNGLEDALLNAFTERDAGAHLEQLNLSYNLLTSEALVGLAISPLPHLTSLELIDNPIHDHGIIAFVSSESARRLKRLRFGSRRWSLAAVHAISASKRLGRLEELDLNLSELPYEQRQRLSRASHLPPNW